MFRVFLTLSDVKLRHWCSLHIFLSEILVFIKKKLLLFKSPINWRCQSTNNSSTNSYLASLMEYYFLKIWTLLQNSSESGSTLATHDSRCANVCTHHLFQINTDIFNSMLNVFPMSLRTFDFFLSQPLFLSFHNNSSSSRLLFPLCFLLTHRLPSTDTRCCMCVCGSVMVCVRSRPEDT